MNRRKMTCMILAILMAFFLTGCQDSRTVLSERHEEAVEAAVLRRHTGRFNREISAMDGRDVDIHVKLFPQSGNISVTVTNQAGDVCLSVTERASLPENGTVTVTVPSAELPCVVQADMTLFSGEYEISWGAQPESAL